MELFLKVVTVTIELGFWVFLISAWVVTGIVSMREKSFLLLILNNLVTILGLVIILRIAEVL